MIDTMLMDSNDNENENVNDDNNLVIDNGIESDYH